jgi:hypothetical protein
MAHFSRENNVNFYSKLLDRNPIPPELGKIEIAINTSLLSHQNAWIESNCPMMKDLRHGYLHYSAYYGSPGGANEPQFTNDGPIKGRRMRIIQNG